MRRLTVRLMAALIGLLALFECAAAQTSVSVAGMGRDQDRAVVDGDALCAYISGYLSIPLTHAA